MKRSGWRVGLAAIVGVLSITRAILYFTQSDDAVTPSSTVTFNATGGIDVPGGIGTGLPTDILTAVPTGPFTDFPTDIPSDAPTQASLGPVRYQITGTGATASVVEYTTADLGVKDVDHASLPYRKTVDGGIGEYFSVYARAGDGTTITCEIVAHGGTVEKKQTAHGRHAHVSCRWDVPF